METPQPFLLKKILVRVALDLGFSSEKAETIAEDSLAACQELLLKELSPEEIQRLSPEDSPRIFRLLARALESTVRKEVM